MVVATLRPAGIARIDGRRVDVVSRGEMIESGSPVRVLSVEGNRVVVVRDEDSQPEPEESPR
jgi:membrane-bound serine protease (ClpP class)